MEFYKSCLDLKHIFPLELTKILNSTKDILNKSENIKVPSNVKDLLGGIKRIIEKICKDIDELAKITLVQHTFFL